MNYHFCYNTILLQSVLQFLQEFLSSSHHRTWRTKIVAEAEYFIIWNKAHSCLKNVVAEYLSPIYNYFLHLLLSLSSRGGEKLSPGIFCVRIPEHCCCTGRLTLIHCCRKSFVFVFVFIYPFWCHIPPLVSVSKQRRIYRRGIYHKDSLGGSGIQNIYITLIFGSRGD